MKPGPKRALSDEQVLDAAFALLNAKGFSAISIRGVAEMLGVAPGAIYTYFASKRDLLRGMNERVFGRIDFEALNQPGTEGTLRIRQAALAVRQELVASDGAANIIMSGPLDGPNTLKFNEALLSILISYGLDTDNAARAAYAITVYVLGFIVLESADAAAENSTATEAQGTLQGDEPPAGPELADFPLTAASAGVIAQYNSTAQFVWGLDHLFEGLLGRGVLN